MPELLPERPDLGQLRRRAKELRDACRRGEPAATALVAEHAGATDPSGLSLATAQLVLARHYGFASWPSLKFAVEAGQRRIEAGIAAFVRASLEDASQAQRLLELAPEITAAPLAAAVLGDAGRISAIIAADPGWATRPDGERGWAPLLYACYSRWHSLGPSMADASLATVHLLLDAGAPVDSHNGRLPGRGYRSALHGSVAAKNAPVCRLLLERGANPDDRASLVEAVQQGSTEIVRELLAHGASIDRTWALEAAAFAPHPEVVRVMLETAVTKYGQRQAAQWATDALVAMGRHSLRHPGAVDAVRTLIEFGADADGSAGEPAPVVVAARAGRQDVVEVLRAGGATSPVAPTDLIVGACARGDESVLAAEPALRTALTTEQPAAVLEVAGEPSEVPVRLLLDMGAPVVARNSSGETALHIAAYEGRTATVKLLLERGAEIDALDDVFNSTPLAFATVGSGEQPNPDGDWPGTVLVLLESGANRNNAWVAGKPPSEEVAAILSTYGIGPSQADEEDDDGSPAPLRQTAGCGLLPISQEAASL